MVEGMELALDFDIEHAREKLERTADEGRTRVDRIKQELEAKLEALNDQADRSRPEVRGQVKERDSASCARTCGSAKRS